MLGARAAEDIIYSGVISTGAHNDLERATEMARQMVMRYGMSERLGNQVFGKPMMGQYLESTMSFGEQRKFSNTRRNGLMKRSHSSSNGPISG
jgi:cell division protease FtsH